MKDFTGIVAPAALASPPRRGPSMAERRIQVVKVLRLSPGTSDRALAAFCGASREMVARYRAELVAAGCIAEVPLRAGRDGKKYRRAKGGAS